MKHFPHIQNVLRLLTGARGSIIHTPFTLFMHSASWQVYEALQSAGNARRVGKREVERQQKELRQAVMLAAEITVWGGGMQENGTEVGMYARCHLKLFLPCNSFPKP